MKNPYRRYNSLLLLLGSLLLLSAPTWSAFPSNVYFPLPDGGRWNYIAYNALPYNTWVVAGVVNINGVPTKRLAESAGGIMYLSNDANGIRVHRIDVPPAPSSATFRPPIPMARATANIGDRLSSSGIADFLVPGRGVFPLNYTSTAAIVAEERVTVPAGTFDTIRHTLTLRLFGNILGTPVDETSTETRWLAPGTGVVKYYEAGFGTARLVDTNVSQKRSGVIVPLINTILLSD